jgi:hypothetical protein
VDAKVNGGDGHQEITVQRFSPLCSLEISKVTSEGVKNRCESTKHRKEKTLVNQGLTRVYLFGGEGGTRTQGNKHQKSRCSPFDRSDNTTSSLINT